MVTTSSNSRNKLSLMACVIRRTHNFPPAFQALFIQLLALGICYLFIPKLNVFLESSISPILAAFILGAIALLFSHILNLAYWWHFINFLFAPALIATLYLHISPGYFFLAFMLMAMIYWSTFRTQVPLYLSSRKVWQSISTLLPAQPGFRFVDLGSGLGGLLGYLHQIRPDGTYFGIESAPLPIFISWLRFHLVKNLHSSWSDFWTHNLADYDVVYAYLSPVPMTDLWEKARLEMRPGTLFISNTFGVPGVTPTQVIALDDFNKSTLYIWRM